MTRWLEGGRSQLVEFRHLYRVLAAHRRMIGLLCVSAAVNAFLLTFFMSEKYEATALVLVRPQAPLRFGQADKVLLDFPVAFGAPFQVTSRTYSEVIKSRTIAEKVVRSLGLDKAPDESLLRRALNGVKAVGSGFVGLLKYGRVVPGDPLDRAVGEVRSSLVVIPTRDTYVFEIKCRFPKAPQSAKIANAAAAAFVEYSREANAEEAKGSREFIETRLRESEREFETARLELRRFRDDQGTLLLDKELAARVGEVARLESALADTDKELSGVRAEVAELALQLSQQDRYLKSSTTMTDSPVAVNLKKELAELEVQRSAYLTTLTPAHPKLVTLDARRAEILSLLRDNSSRVVSEETSSLNGVRRALEQKWLLDQSTLQNLEAQRQRLAGLLATSRAGQPKLTQAQSELSRLELALDTTQDTYRIVRKRYDEAKIHETERLSEIRVVAPAIEPRVPASPIRIYNALVAFLLAAVLGLLFALSFEYLNARLHDVEDAERALGLPVLAAIPSVPVRRTT